MGTAFKTLAVATIFAVLGLVTYGYTIDMAPAPQSSSQSVILNGG